MAAWAMIPDKLDDASEGGNRRFGAFLTTLVAFFIVEIGDKTQIATIGLGARYQSVALVTIGTTAGMLLANVPAVLLGDRITRIVPMKWVRLGAAASFAILGLWRSEEHTSELQSLMRISYAVFCLKKKKNT